MRTLKRAIGSALAAWLLSFGAVGASAAGTGAPCTVQSSFGSPIKVTSPPPANALARFAVLRRPQTPQDSLPASIGALKGIQLVPSQLQSYAPQFERLLSTDAAGMFYLVTGVTAKLHVNRGCERGLSPTQLLVFRRFVAFLRARAVQPGYCILHLRMSVKPVESTSFCATFAEGSSIFSFGSSLDRGGRELSGLVPDGVTAAHFSFRDGEPPLSAPVAGNFVQAHNAPSGVAVAIKRFLRLIQRDNIRARRHHAPTQGDRAKLGRLNRTITLGVAPLRVDLLDAGGTVSSSATAPGGALGATELQSTGSFNVASGSPGQ